MLRCPKRLQEVAKICNKNLLQITKSYQMMLKVAKSCQILPKVTKICQKLSKIVKSFQKFLKVAKTSQKLPKITQCGSRINTKKRGQALFISLQTSSLLGTEKLRVEASWTMKQLSLCHPWHTTAQVHNAHALIVSHALGA